MRYDENNFEEVGELLSTLKRVEPPGDFDMRVRGRIAQGRPTEIRRWPMMVARIGIPAALLVALGGYFGWSSLYQPTDTPSVAAVQGLDPLPDPNPRSVERELVSNPSNPADPVPAGKDKILAPPPDNILGDRMTVGRNLEARVPGETETTVPGTIDPRGGSLDFGVRPERERFPNGIDPRRVITNANMGPRATHSAVSFLAILGISASCTASGCRVISVSANSVAANSGVRAGDIMESVDGTPLRANTSINGQFSAASVRIRRDGSILNLSLRP